MKKQAPVAKKNELSQREKLLKEFLNRATSTRDGYMYKIINIEYDGNKEPVMLEGEVYVPVALDSKETKAIPMFWNILGGSQSQNRGLDIVEKKLFTSL